MVARWCQVLYVSLAASRNTSNCRQLYHSAPESREVLDAVPLSARPGINSAGIRVSFIPLFCPYPLILPHVVEGVLFRHSPCQSLGECPNLGMDVGHVGEGSPPAHSHDGVR